MIVFLVEFFMLSTSLLASSPVLETGAYFVEPIRFLMVIKLIVVRSLGFLMLMISMNHLKFYFIAWREKMRSMVIAFSVQCG